MAISVTGIKAALIDSSNIVRNIIVWDDSCECPEGYTAIVLDANEQVATGWIYSNENSNHVFTNPNPSPEPESYVAPQPSINELKAQLEALTAQIAALSANK